MKVTIKPTIKPNVSTSADHDSQPVDTPPNDVDADTTLERKASKGRDVMSIIRSSFKVRL